jgi:hypothetical protein
MPIASTDDLILATVTYLHHLLVAPPNGIPLLHLPPSTTETLVQITETLMQPSHLTNDKLTPKARPVALAPPLRVTFQEPPTTTLVTPAPPLRVAPNEPILYQGYMSPTGEHDTKGTDTCKFIKKQDVPKDKKVTYIRILSEYREQKGDPYRIRMIVGGNLVEVTGDISTKGADLVTAKVLINDIISTPNCRATALDIKDFYLNNDFPTKEYVCICKENIPEDIWAQYNLDDFLDNQGWVYSEVSKGMYGLPQAG